MDNKNIVGSRLNAALARRNVKQKELAQYLNVPDNTISYFCSGKRTPNIRQIIEIAKRLEISTDYLLGFDVPSTTEKATKELCSTLGLSEDAVEYLQNPNNDTIRQAINFLFWQHHNARKPKNSKINKFEKMFAGKLEGDCSILELLYDFVSLQRATHDVRLLLTPDGSLSFGKIDIDTKMTEEVADLRLEIKDFAGGFADVSLLKIASKDITETIADVLNFISYKRAAQIEWEKEMLEGDAFNET